MKPWASIGFAGAIILGLTSTLFAQDFGGVKGGLTIAKEKVTGSPGSLTTDGLVAFHLGFYFVSSLSDRVALQYESLFSMEGGKLAGVKDKVSYLNLPVMVRINAGENFNFHFGPQLGFKIGAKSGEFDVTSEIKETSFSAVVGAALESTGGGVVLGIRYNHGLTNILKKDVDAGVRLTSLQLWGGVRLFDHR